MVEPLTPERYKIQIPPPPRLRRGLAGALRAKAGTVGAETVETLRRVQDLMRHSVPDGDPAVIVDRALTLLLAQLEREKLAATDRPRPGKPPKRRSRYVAAAVRRAVWARDGNRCTFIGRDGHRCTETAFLELHHLEPYALGGEATVETLTLRCRAHNQYEAEQEFGVHRRASRHRDASTAPTTPEARADAGSASAAEDAETSAPTADPGGGTECRRSAEPS